jgi:AcrR family transcriptional regulator
MRIRSSKETNAATSPTWRSLPVRDRVLEVACELFAEAGFHGTHLREVCKRAWVNVAGVCYHFKSKEGLYQAVVMEAGRRLSDHEDFLAPRQLPPEESLLKLVESLLLKLSADGAWVGKLLTRELVDSICGTHNCVVPALERDFLLLQAVVRNLLGDKADSETVRLHALSVIGECIFYSLAGENPQHPIAQLASGLASRTQLARFLTARLLRSLNNQVQEQEIPGL